MSRPGSSLRRLYSYMFDAILKSNGIPFLLSIAGGLASFVLFLSGVVLGQHHPLTVFVVLSTTSIVVILTGILSILIAAPFCIRLALDEFAKEFEKQEDNKIVKRITHAVQRSSSPDIADQMKRFGHDRILNPHIIDQFYPFGKTRPGEERLMMLEANVEPKSEIILLSNDLSNDTFDPKNKYVNDVVRTNISERDVRYTFYVLDSRTSRQNAVTFIEEFQELRQKGHKIDAYWVEEGMFNINIISHSMLVREMGGDNRWKSELFIELPLEIPSGIDNFHGIFLKTSTSYRCLWESSVLSMLEQKRGPSLFDSKTSQTDEKRTS